MCLRPNTKATSKLLYYVLVKTFHAIKNSSLARLDIYLCRCIR